MSHSTANIIPRCTAQRHNGEFCDGPTAPDMPFPICEKHAIRVYMRVAETAELKRQSLVAAVVRPESSTEKAARVAKESRRRTAYSEQAVVYYVRIGEHIKIGTTINVTERLRGLRVDPDALIATEPGSYELERRRHGEFADERVGRREDFKPSKRLMKHIAAVLSEHGEPNRTGYIHVA